jgi:signal transduction histidine kinase
MTVPFTLRLLFGKEAKCGLVVRPRRLLPRLTVADNGRGFVPGATEAAAATPWSRLEGGNGLTNMRTRLEEIGGKCDVRSEPGAGTSVTFAVPVKTPA